MANQIIKARYKTKTDTEANWIKNNPVLLAGEMAISSDKDNKYKVGDGTSKWSALKYAKANLEKSDVTTALGYTPPTKDTTYSTGTASTAGLTKLYTSTGTATDGTMTQAAIKAGLDSKAPSSHTHSYAGSSSAGGSATSAVKLDTATAGSATQPVYFSNGKPVATTYTLGKSVPSNAQFTDTRYEVATTASDGLMAFTDKRKLNHIAYAHYGTTSNDKGYYLILINSKSSWMLAFTIRLYSNYRAIDLMISGHNNTPNHWHSPTATMIGDSSKNNITVLFGYENSGDDIDKLWVAIPAGDYTGLDIFNVVNGYTQVDDISNLFIISHASSMPTIVQQTIVAYAPYYRNETVSNATTASKLGSSTVGSSTQPVYLKAGTPTATTYTLGKSVPNNAVFTDTNTKVTSVGNHYTPSGGTTTSASGGSLTDITNSSSGVPVVTGITKDAAGHVTGITSVALKSTNTTYELMSVTEFEALFK